MMREGEKIRPSLATHGEPDEVADALDIGANGTDPTVLRAALINAMRRIAAQDREMAELDRRLANLGRPAP